ncbi:MAG: heme degradation protein [Phycisphaeraceae bacterium]|nr:heme degradation protein [Phycisphaeraceae bacterium]
MPTATATDRRSEIRAAREADRSAMTVVLARKLGVPEVEVIRAMPPEAAIELDGGRWEELVRAFELLGDVHVVASNGSVTLECFGSFGSFSTWGDYFNVQTKSLDMHIRTTTIAGAFAVRKPSHMDNVPTLSFQFFNHQGDSAFKVFLTFGGKQPSAEKQQQFDDLVARFGIGR